MRPSIARIAVCLVAAVIGVLAVGPAVSGLGPHVVHVRAMSRNLYVGADLTPAFGARTFGEFVAVVTAIYAKVVATNIPERMERLGDEIASFSPEVVGLQEVVLWRSQTPADFSPVPNAVDVEFDFLQLLLDALAARGHPYRAVAVVTNVDVESPRVTATGLQDIRLTDRDVLLVRADLPAKHLSAANVRSANFRTNLVITTPLFSITLLRGWVAADVTVRGETVRIINTHLEAFHPVINAVQGGEVLAGPAATGLPVVLLGDLNSAADGSTSATYGNFLAAGYGDAWAVRRPGDPGLTCCHSDDLRNPVSTFTMRIDYVMFRGAFGVGPVWLFGEEPADRTPSGLWPSDHAGVAAMFTLP